MKPLKESTSFRMSRIRGRNTKPEKYVRTILHKKGFRFSLNKRSLPGKPDIVLKKYKTIINVNGCFWHHHKCGSYNIPKNNRKFWLNKFKNNKKRDKINTKKLRKLGWKVYKVWECNLEKDIKGKIKLL